MCHSFHKLLKRLYLMVHKNYLSFFEGISVNSNAEVSFLRENLSSGIKHKGSMLDLNNKKQASATSTYQEFNGEWK